MYRISRPGVCIACMCLCICTTLVESVVLGSSEVRLLSSILVTLAPLRRRRKSSPRTGQTLLWTTSQSLSTHLRHDRGRASDARGAGRALDSRRSTELPLLQCAASAGFSTSTARAPPRPRIGEDLVSQTRRRPETALHPGGLEANDAHRRQGAQGINASCEAHQRRNACAAKDPPPPRVIRVEVCMACASVISPVIRPMAPSLATGTSRTQWENRTGSRPRSRR